MKSFKNTLAGQLLLVLLGLTLVLALVSAVLLAQQIKTGKLEVIRRVIAYTDYNGPRLSGAFSKSRGELDKLVAQDMLNYPDLASVEFFSETGESLYAKKRRAVILNQEFDKSLLPNSTETNRCFPKIALATAEDFYSSLSYGTGQLILGLFDPEINCSMGEVAGIEVLRPLDQKEQKFVRYRFSYQVLYENLLPIQGLLLTMLVLLLLQMVAAYQLVLKPLKILKRAAFAMAEGNLEQKIQIKSRTEIGVLGNFMNEVSRNLAKVIRDLDEKERLANEMDIATRIQENLIPEEMPELPGLEIYGKTRPTTEVGGDVFDFIRQDENNVVLYIGDVTGHGVAACLVMIMVDVLMHTFSRVCQNLKDLFVQVNRNLAPRIDATMFVSMLGFKWNIPNQQLTYVGAGHEYLVHYHARSRKCTATPAGGIALGMLPDVEALLTEKEIPLEEDDVIVIYSDGISEALDENAEMFGLERLTSAVERFGYQDAKGVFESLTKILSDFMGKAPQRDDVTLIVIKCKGSSLDEIEKMIHKAKLSIQEQGLRRDRTRWKWTKK